MALVAIVDTNANPANRGKEPAMDALLVLLERFDALVAEARTDGVVVCDVPAGGRGEESTFLARCIDELAAGTDYVQFERLALPVLTAPSHLLRLLQLADVIVGCATACVAGEQRFAPPVFESILPLFRRVGDRIGGYGFKLHPDGRYLNLYHWLLGDREHSKESGLVSLPVARMRYATDPWTE